MGFSRVFLDTDLIYRQIKDCGTRVEWTAENELREKFVFKLPFHRLLEEKQACSPSPADGEYVRSLSDSTGRREEEEEEKEGWGERRSISLGEEKIKVDDASPTPSSDQECLGEPFSSLSSLSNFLKRKEKERSKQLSINGSRQLGPTHQVFHP